MKTIVLMSLCLLVGGSFSIWAQTRNTANPVAISNIDHWYVNPDAGRSDRPMQQDPSIPLPRPYIPGATPDTYGALWDARMDEILEALKCADEDKLKQYEGKIDYLTWNMTKARREDFLGCNTLKAFTESQGYMFGPPGKMVWPAGMP